MDKQELKSKLDALLRNSQTEEDFILNVKQLNSCYYTSVNFQKGVKDPSKQYLVSTCEFGTISGTYLGLDLCGTILKS
jgi:hypothetical protein